MRKLMLAGAIALAGIGHNMPPAPVPTPMHEQMREANRIRRRENKKLWQRLRRKPKDRARHHTVARAIRKNRKFDPGYKPGKMFKGHRI